MSKITDFEPAASILLGADVIDGVSRAPRWGVYFYDIGTRPYGRVVTIQDVPFVFTQIRAYTHLNGATLDYCDGRVTVAGKPSDDLAPGTLNSILKQSGLKK
jgi:hypothetical protein